MPAGGPVGLIVGNFIRGDFFESGKTTAGIARLRKRNGSPDKRADSWRDSHQTFVKQNDFLPIYFAADNSMGVNGLNGCLQLITTHAFERRSRAQVFFSFVDHGSRPESGILAVERNKLSSAAVACPAPSFAMQHESEQTICFGFIRHQLR